jgi:Cellulase (glycosyl hydrolase family 5)/PKD domain/IPT/TIG domain/Carboxypeptidase regulatory-like domain/Putative Ig domain
VSKTLVNLLPALVPGGTAQIKGRVTSATTSKPVEGIEVCAYNEVAYQCTSTDATGEYDITGLDAGEYTVDFAVPFEVDANYLTQYYKDKSSYVEATPVVVGAGATVNGINAALVEGGQITGTVTDASSKAPIEGIEVCGEPRGEGEFFERCAKTAAGGAYDIVGLATGKYTVAFFVPYESNLNYLRQYYNGKTAFGEANAVSVTAGVTTPNINAALQPGGQITGKVTDAVTKTALSEIQVCAFDGPEGTGGCALTTASGEYDIGSLPTGEYKVVEFATPYQSNLNYLRQYYNDKATSAEAEPVSVTAGLTTPNINAPLQPGGQISGKVTAAATKAALGEIEVCASENGGEYFERCATTNADGDYTVSSLPTGVYTVAFSSFSGPYAPQYYENKVAFNEAQPVSVTAGMLTPNINAAMQLGGEITGKVTDANTKAAVSGVEVCASPVGSGIGGCTTTDANGEYALTKLAADEYRVEFVPESASAQKYLRQYYNSKATYAEANLVSVSAGATTSEINAALHVGGEVSGAVTKAETDAALAGIGVCAFENSGEFFERCTNTNASGEYSVVGLPTGSYIVSFSSEEYAPQYYNGKSEEAEATPVEVAAGSTTPNINAAMFPAAEITGVVSDANTKAPIAEIEVCALQATSGEYTQCVDTNASGEYRLRPLAAGEYKVEFTPYFDSSANYTTQYYNGKTSFGEATVVTLAAGGSASNISAALHEGGKITGTVTEATTTSPIEGIEICARGSGGEDLGRCGFTNASGEYAVKALTTGEYKVEFTGDGHNYLTQYYNGKASFAEGQLVSVTSGETTSGINATMYPGGKITGTVTGAVSKAPISGIFICAYPKNGGSGNCASTNASGEYSIIALATAEYAVEFSGDGQNYITQYYNGRASFGEAQAVSVTAGDTTPSINAALEVGGEITGTVTTAKTKEPIANIQAYVLSTTGSFITSASTNAHGEYTALALPTGEYKVEFISFADEYRTQYYNNKEGLGEATLVTATAGGHVTPNVNAALIIAPPVLTSPPAISGSDQEGHKLNEAHGSWKNKPTEYTYQWVRCSKTGNECGPIGGATEQSYVPVFADVGHELRVEETAHNEGGTSSPATSEPTEPIAVAPPENIKLPTISGTAQQSKMLTDVAGSWTNEPTKAKDQWLRCNKAGAECTAISGAIGETYVPVVADVGGTVRVEETAENAAGPSSPATSAQTAVVVPPIPVNISLPTITGTAQQGQTLTEHNGAWEYSTTELKHQWLQCEKLGDGCLPIPGATGETYVPGPLEVGGTIRVEEAATNAGGTSEYVMSTQTSEVLPAPPVNISPPTITGTAQQGMTLTEHHGAWENNPTGYKVEWLRCNKEGEGCVPIPAAPEETYVPTSTDVGHTIRVSEAAKNAGGTGEPAMSVATPVVVPPVPVNITPPTITGTAQQSKTLTEHNGTWEYAPTELTHQWLRCNKEGASCEAIESATGETYVPVGKDVGHTIRVEEIAHNEGGTSKPALSEPTAAVVSAPPEIITPPTITGTAQQGQTLTEHHGTWTNEPTGYADTWLRCNEAGEQCSSTGATGETYAPVSTDVGHTIRLEETAHNEGSTSSPALSQPTAVVVPPPPVDLTLPTITGEAVQGKTLTEHHGAWEYSPTGYKLQWLQCDSLGTGCLPISGANGESYVPVAKDVGQAIRVEEIADNAGGDGEPATSEPTPVVVASKPVNISSPTISGTAQQGRTLTEEHGKWTNEPTGFKYEWLRCTKEGAECGGISDATEQTYVPVAADIGHELEVQEIAINAGGESNPATSAPTSVVLVQTLAVVTPSLPGATVGSHYSTLAQASGGDPPYKWSVASGSLPEGVSLNETTGQLSGTPTSPGTASFSLQVTDSGAPPASISAALSIAVAPSGPPSIASVTPNVAPLVGGVTTVVTGTGFSTTPGATTFSFGADGAGKDVNCPGPTVCILTVPPGAAGTVDVIAAVGAFTSEPNANSAFTYSRLALTSVSPNAGNPSGGTSVTITGSGFSTAPGGTEVDFGEQPASSVSCLSSTSCTAIAPAQSPAIVDVRVTTGGLTTPIEPADRFSYSSPPPEAIHVVFDPSPFAPPTDLEPGETVTFSAIAEHADGTPVPGATIYLAVSASEGAGTFTVGSTVISNTPAPFVADSHGQIAITYTAPEHKAQQPASANPSIAATTTPEEAPGSWDAYFFSEPPEPTPSGPGCHEGESCSQPFSCEDSQANELVSCPTTPPWVLPLLKWIAKEALSPVDGCIQIPLDVSTVLQNNPGASQAQQLETLDAIEALAATESGLEDLTGIDITDSLEYAALNADLTEGARDVLKAAADYHSCVAFLCDGDPICEGGVYVVTFVGVNTVVYLIDHPPPVPTLPELKIASEEPPNCPVPQGASGAHLVFYKSPIAPPGSLEPGESTEATLTVEGTNKEPVDGVAVYLAGELDGGGVHIGAGKPGEGEGQLGEGWQSFAAPEGVLHMTYTAPRSPEPDGFSRIDATLCPPGGMTVSGEGFAPGSPVKALLSDPFLLGTADADSSGKVSISFPAPPGYGNGPEQIELVGVNAKGEPLVQVVDTLAGQASTYGDDAVAFETAPAPPSVGTLSPATGSGAGGTLVTITGSHLAGATSVTFGGTPASGFTVLSPSAVLAEAPPGTGTVDVTVTTSAGESAKTEADHFKYVAPVPVDKTPPTITGTPEQSQTLTEHHGTWTNEPTSFTYQWVQCDALGEGCLPISHATEQTYVPVVANVGHRLRVEEITHNAAGPSEPAVSEPTAVITAAVPVNITPPTIVGTAQKEQTLVEQHGKWTNEPTGYKYEWLRCNKEGGECSPIPGAVNQTYLATAADVGDTLDVNEVAINGGGESAPATSKPSAVVAPVPLHAVAGENVSTTVGVAVAFDGSGSTPAGEIESYRWEFADGAEATGENVSHAYGSPGTFTAKLTVSRGAESTSATVTVTVAPAPTHSAIIEVTDRGHAPLAGATVLYIGSGGARTQATTEGDGKASLPGMPNGTDTVYAYKSGFQPAVGQVNVSGGAGEATIVLSTGEIVTSTLKSHEMTLKEIEEAGINTSDPANQNVYEFEVRLAFIEHETVGFHCYINSHGEFVGGCTSGGGGGGSGGWGGSGGVGPGPSCSPNECVGSGIVAVPEVVEGKPLIQWLILRGKASILKQFFEVSEVVQDLSPEPFKLAAGNATLNVPPGMSLAPTATPQSATQAVPAIPGDGSAETNWIVRGDKPGEYFLSANYQSKLEPFEARVEIEARLASPLKVWGIEAISLTVQADEGFLTEGIPYHVKIGVTNKANVPLYNVGIEISSTVHEHFIFQPEQQYGETVSELKPGETTYAPEDILVPDGTSESRFNPTLSSAHFVGEEIKPGEGIEEVTPRSLYTLTAPSSGVPNTVHLEWEPVPEAEGYEVFSTPNLDTPFAESPDTVRESLDSPIGVTTLPADAHQAYVEASGSAYYAVSAMINHRATLDFPVIGASGGPREGLSLELSISHPQEEYVTTGAGWLPGETVALYLDTAEGAHYIGVTTADAGGNFSTSVTDFLAAIEKPADAKFETTERFPIVAMGSDGDAATITNMTAAEAAAGFSDKQSSSSSTHGGCSERGAPLGSPSGIQGISPSAQELEAGLTTSGAKITYDGGKPLRLAGVNWYGAEEADFVPGGLQCQSLRTIAHDIRQLGFNTVRLPWSNAMLELDPRICAVGAAPPTVAPEKWKPCIPPEVLSANETLVRGRESAVKIFKSTVKALEEAGVMVILDNHTTDAAWSPFERKVNNEKEDFGGLWWGGQYWDHKYGFGAGVRERTARWVEDWRRMVALFKSDPYVVGADLRNEPARTPYACRSEGRSHNCTAKWDRRWAKECKKGVDFRENWPCAAQRAGNAILGVDPKLLIFVEGTGYATNLTEVEPVGGKYQQLQFLNGERSQLVYSSHTYEKEEWAKKWGHIVEHGIAPVWIGEFGSETASKCPGPKSPQPWLASFIGYLQAIPASWTWWAINGTESDAGVNFEKERSYYQRETFGLLCPSWNSEASEPIMGELEGIMQER